MSRAYQYWVSAEEIAREVITADIQRYLGPDALVRPGRGAGEDEGQDGYWVTAHKMLSRQMIQDLKADSQRWRQEAGHRSRGFEYHNSSTHAARQQWGPSPPPPTPASISTPLHQGFPPQSLQGKYGQNHALSMSSQHTQYPTHQPRLQERNPSNATQEYYTASDGRKYPVPQQSSYGQPAAQRDTTSKSSEQSNPTPGYYTASDGRQYPLPQQSNQGQPTPRPSARDSPFKETKTTARPGYYIASDGREYPSTTAKGYPLQSSPQMQTAKYPRRDSPSQETQPSARPGYYLASDGREYPLSKAPTQGNQSPQDPKPKARPGYYLASDGREYPLAKQPDYGHTSKASTPAHTSGYYTASDGRQYPRVSQPGYGGIHSPISDASGHNEDTVMGEDSDGDDRPGRGKGKRRVGSRDFEI